MGTDSQESDSDNTNTKVQFVYSDEQQEIDTPNKNNTNETTNNEYNQKSRRGNYNINQLYNWEGKCKDSNAILTLRSEKYEKKYLLNH